MLFLERAIKQCVMLFYFNTSYKKTSFLYIIQQIYFLNTQKINLKVNNCFVFESHHFLFCLYVYFFIFKCLESFQILCADLLSSLRCYFLSAELLSLHTDGNMHLRITLIGG